MILVIVIIYILNINLTKKNLYDHNGGRTIRRKRREVKITKYSYSTIRSYLIASKLKRKTQQHKHVLYR